MLHRRLVHISETHLRRSLSMLELSASGGAKIFSKPKGAFILQAPAPSNAQARQVLVCSPTTGLALAHQQMPDSPLQAGPWFCADQRRPLSMLGQSASGGATIFSKPKGAFILQAPAPSNAQERLGLVCFLMTICALSHTHRRFALRWGSNCFRGG